MDAAIQRADVNWLGAAEELQHDEARDRFVAGEGYRLLRFTNEDVYNALEGVLTSIERELKKAPPSPPPNASHLGPPPLPLRGRGQEEGQ